MVYLERIFAEYPAGSNYIYSIGGVLWGGVAAYK